MKNFRKDIDGAIAVEFALIMPIMLMLIFGVFQVSMLFLTYNQSMNVARELSRQLHIGNVSAANAQQWVNGRMPTHVNFNLNVTHPDDHPDGLHGVTIEMSMADTVVADPFGFFNGRTMTVNVVATPFQIFDDEDD